MPVEASSRQRLDALLRILFAVFSVVGLVPLTSSVVDSSGWSVELLPIVLTLLTTVATLVRWPAVIGVVSLGAALVASIVLPGDGLDGAPRILLGVLGFLLVIHYSRERVNRLFAVVAVSYVGLHVAAQPRRTWLTAVDDAVLSASLTLTGAVFMAVLVATLTRLDAVRAERVRQELDETFDATAARMTADARHLIHNEVIGTLSAVANYRGVDAERIREACRRVGRTLSADDTDDGEDGATLSSLVARAAAESLVRVTIEPHTLDPRLDTAQFVALDRAIREALRNVRRHAGVTEASIGWQRDEDSWQLLVTDHGAGSASLTGSWGVTHAIARSLADLGGSAEVRSTPGAGTVVDLRWPTEQAVRALGAIAREHRSTLRALGEDTSLALRVAVPVLAGNAWLAVRYSWGDPTAVPQIALALAVVVATLLTVVWQRQHPLSGWWLGVVALVASGAIATGLSMAEPDALRDYDSWVIGLVSVVLTLTAFYVPPAWVLVLVGPSAVVVVVAALASGLPLGAAGGAVNATVLPVVLGGAFGAYLRWTRATTDHEEFWVGHLAREAHRRQVARGARDHQLAHVRSVAGPWLSSVGTGELSLEDSTTLAEAQQLAVEMRDELHLPGLLDPVLRSRVASARRRGTEVELLAPDGDARGTEPYLRLLDRALDLQDHLERVIVDLPHGDRRHGEVVLLPPVRDEALAFLLRCLHGSDHTVLADVFSTRILLGDPVFPGREA